MDFELRNLRHVVTVARRLSFSRAAEDLGISQPALTRSIQAFERQLGMRLFDRGRAGVTMTAQGRLLVDRAIVLLANADDLGKHFEATARGREGRVRFGLAPMPARAFLPAAVAELIRDAPDLAVEVVVRNVDALWPMLVAGEIEFFVSAEGQVPDTPPTGAETLGHFPISLIVRPGHPLLDGECPGRTFPFLLSSSARHALPDDVQERVHGSPYVVEDFAALVSLTAMSDAVWISSTYAVADEIGAGLLTEVPRRRGAGPRRSRIVIYTLDRRSPSPAALKLKERFRQIIRTIEKRLG